MAGRLGRSRLGLAGLGGFFGRKGADGSGAGRSINLEFVQDMDGWNFISFRAELSRMSICNSKIVKNLNFFPKACCRDITVVNVL